ncbi:hypothetical protein BCR44DRAFT_80215 [Catenaria anguillulae PL171]|uniref:Caspase domain-domain-containing protein n=1 Tax=Catenaria anguillulae PL171 TaxID=765915 RepID=A0A1Y2HHB0_9FUNG|nr:hypothetical protein BCR44DRAFT_80215 [Catenaria anguillulae PL171]
MNAAILIGLGYPNLAAFARNDSFNNVEAVRQSLCTESTTTVTLIDSTAMVTCETVRAAIQSMVQASRSGDQLLIYFSGVGGCVDDFFGDTGDEDDDSGANEFLRFSDGLLFAKDLSELVALVPNNINVSLTIAIDCTTSDGITWLKLPTPAAVVHFCSGTLRPGSDTDSSAQAQVSPWTRSWIDSCSLLLKSIPSRAVEKGAGCADCVSEE